MIDRVNGDSLFGVHRECGCVSAWIGLGHSNGADVRRFCLEMAATDRDVLRADLTDEMRQRIGSCLHAGRRAQREDG